MKKYLFLMVTVLLLSVPMRAQLLPVRYKDGSQNLNGLVIAPEKANKNRPGILILPAWKGIDKHAKDVAEKLSKSGYYAFIADIYGEGNYPKDANEAGEKAGFYKKNYDKYQQRIRLALAQLVQAGAHSDKIVIIGYCFGGTGALEAARANMPVKGIVSFHGGLGKDASRKNTPINTKVLVCHGADDFYVSPEDIGSFQKEMRDGKADWQMIYYANSVHAFTDPEAGNDNSKGAAYNEKADQRSWQHFLDFLQETL